MSCSFEFSDQFVPTPHPLYKPSL